MTRSTRRALVVAISMLATAMFCALFTPAPLPVAMARARTPLESLFPARFAGWQLDPGEVPLIRPAFERGRQYQMYDQVLERTYVDGEGHRIMLSVAYGRQQSVGLQMHRPEVCYRAGGFRVQDVHAGQIRLGGHTLSVTRLFASLEGRPEPITYWRLLGDEVIADERQFRLRQLSLGARREIPDGLLVRVSSIDADTSAAYRVQARFVRDMANAMDPVQRRRVLGM